MNSDKAIWIGRAIRALVAMALIADALSGLLAPDAIRVQMIETGFPEWTGAVIAVSALASGVLYALPRTALLGAILATGFLGGAICTHVRLGEIASPPQLVSLALGVLAWAGLYLEDARLRAMLPLRRRAAPPLSS